MGIVAERIKSRLGAALDPEHLEINDDSAKHNGHAGARKEGESHFSLLIVSSAFEGLNRVARQRRVNAVLAEELAGPVHALAMRTLTPGEYANETQV